MSTGQEVRRSAGLMVAVQGTGIEAVVLRGKVQGMETVIRPSLPEPSYIVAAGREGGGATSSNTEEAIGEERMESSAPSLSPAYTHMGTDFV